MTSILTSLRPYYAFTVAADHDELDLCSARITLSCARLRRGLQVNTPFIFLLTFFELSKDNLYDRL